MSKAFWVDGAAAMATEGAASTAGAAAANWGVAGSVGAHCTLLPVRESTYMMAKRKQKNTKYCPRSCHVARAPSRAGQSVRGRPFGDARTKEPHGKYTHRVVLTAAWACRGPRGAASVLFVLFAGARELQFGARASELNRPGECSNRAEIGSRGLTVGASAYLYFFLSSAMASWSLVSERSRPSPRYATGGGPMTIGGADRLLLLLGAARMRSDKYEFI